jgi:hypothetical protein
MYIFICKCGNTKQYKYKASFLKGTVCNTCRAKMNNANYQKKFKLVLKEKRQKKRESNPNYIPRVVLTPEQRLQYVRKYNKEYYAKNRDAINATNRYKLRTDEEYRKKAYAAQRKSRKKKAQDIIDLKREVSRLKNLLANKL